jgi:radical SAM superfamily enzyme YgiQ (UPF0313 family)
MVFPWFPTYFWDFRESMKLLNLKAFVPPLGLATVAAMMPVERFDILAIVDLNIEPLTDDAIRSADVIMVTAIVTQEHSLREIIARAKSFGKTVVVGGVYATTLPENVLAMGADHLVLDEAEITLAPFIEDFLANKAEKVYDRNSVRSRITIPLTKEGKPFLTNTPVPLFKLLKLQEYWIMSLQYTRGCPFNCEFCSISSLLGHEMRMKTPDQMIAELNTLLQLGYVGSVFFVDDNFIGNPAELRKFLPKLIAWQEENGYPFAFSTHATINLANQSMNDILENMVKAGFFQILVGIESTNPKVLSKMNKGQNIDTLSLDEKILILQKAGIEVNCSFIFGNDDDTESVFDDLYEFTQKNGIVIPQISPLGINPGTRLYERLNSENRLLPRSDNAEKSHFNFQTKLDMKFFIEGEINLLKKLFSPKSYYKRCIEILRRLGKYPKIKGGNGTWSQAVNKVLFRNIIQRPSLEFVKFVLTIKRISPESLSGAYSYAIKYEHLKKIINLHILYLKRLSRDISK